MALKRAKNPKAAQVEYGPNITPTRNQVVLVLTSVGVTNKWIIKRVTEVSQLKPCST